MSHDMISPENITELIDHLINLKDPATVGLRRILKNKSDHGKDFPLQNHVYEDFTTKVTSAKVFNDTEKRVMELEKENIILKNKLQQQRAASERAVKESYAKGIQEGRERGELAGSEKAREEYLARLKIIEDRLVTMIQQVEQSRKTLYADAHRIILDISVLMARKIISTELKLNPDIVLEVVKKALNYLADRQAFIVRVAPDDLENISQKKDFWASISDRLSKITIEPDARIENGGCIIESSSGITDARISVQIGELIEVIDATWDTILTSGLLSDHENKNCTDSPDLSPVKDAPANGHRLPPDDADMTDESVPA